MIRLNSQVVRRCAVIERDAHDKEFEWLLQRKQDKSHVLVAVFDILSERKVDSELDLPAHERKTQGLFEQIVATVETELDFQLIKRLLPEGMEKLDIYSCPQNEILSFILSDHSATT